MPSVNDMAQKTIVPHHQFLQSGRIIHFQSVALNLVNELIHAEWKHQKLHNISRFFKSVWGGTVEQCQAVVFIVDDLGFCGPGIPDPLTELCQPQEHCPHA